jgi:hypothetical protein
MGEPKLSRRRRRRLRGKNRARPDYNYSGWGDAMRYGLLGDMHIGMFSRASFKPEGGAEYLDLGEMTPTGRNLEKQRRYYDGAYAMGAYAMGPDKFLAVYPRPDALMGGDILHEYRSFAAADWDALERRVLQHELTKLSKLMGEKVDTTLRNTMLHGSSNTATVEDDTRD